MSCLSFFGERLPQRAETGSGDGYVSAQPPQNITTAPSTRHDSTLAFRICEPQPLTVILRLIINWLVSVLPGRPEIDVGLIFAFSGIDEQDALLRFNVKLLL